MPAPRPLHPLPPDIISYPMTSYPLSTLIKLPAQMVYLLEYYFFNNNVIYNLQFGFRQQYSTSHVLINLTENIRKALDDENRLWSFCRLTK